MKVEKLTGVLLDYWVAKAQGFKLPAGDYDQIDVPLVVYCDVPIIPEWKGGNFGGYDISPDAGGTTFQPSMVWGHGGPIIERERICTFPAGEHGWAAFVQVEPACQYVDTHALDEITGTTPLVAAMRAYVASKFGDEVPDEIAHP